MKPSDIKYGRELIHWLQGGDVWYRNTRTLSDWQLVETKYNMLSFVQNDWIEFTMDRGVAFASEIMAARREGIPEDDDPDYFHYRVALFEDKMGEYYTGTQDSTEYDSDPEKYDKEFVGWVHQWRRVRKS